MSISRRDFLAAAATLAAGEASLALSAQPDRPEDFAKAVYKVTPIGRIRNPKGGPVQLEIFAGYIPGLLRLDKCSHVMVLWWFHKNDTPRNRGILQVHPRGNPDNPLTGVFATRSPLRPNLIAVTVCKVLSVKDGLVTIDQIDAFDDTPILDLKIADPGQRREDENRG